MFVGSFMAVYTKRQYKASLMRTHYMLKGAKNLRAEHRNEKYKNNRCKGWYDLQKDIFVINCPCLRSFFKNRTQDMEIEKEIGNSNWSKVEERRQGYIQKSINDTNTISRKGVDHMIQSLCNRR